MTVVFCPNSLGFSRLGVAATRKIGGAVGRNRAKRRVRDVFRRHRTGESVDIVVIPRRELIAAPFERVEAEYVGILRRHRRGPRG
jgi:ribonuclease P protein component